uniref:outer membrane protein assembly factor BamB family protein n=1 Tax=Paractinoplanes polyasparticus TaxID=2856853 RepID=UPI001C84F622|nr:PQQ-binding-like beta-propeller repeat protein [Actinoplanes polyasparticus]
MRLLLVSLLVVLTAAGCWVPVEADPPTLADEPLVEVYRIPSPVPAPGEGRRQWAFVDPGSGVIAEGTGLAAVDFETGLVRWTQTLPGTYAASSANRPMVLDDYLVVPGRGGAVRVLSRWSGDLLWERKSPGGRMVVAGSGLEAAVVLNHCDARGCDLTALLLETGKRAWKVRTAERVTLTDGLHTVGRTTISALSPLDGRRLWTVPTPPGPLPVLKPSLYRLAVITPPTRPGCRIVLRGIDFGKQVWKREARTCDFDVTLDGLLLPEPGRVTVLDDYHGTARTVPIRPGEQLVTGELAWSEAGGYRIWREFPAALGVPDPDSGRPWGVRAGAGWLLASGPGVVFYDQSRGLRRSFPAATAFVVHGSNRLIYQVGDQLVGLGSTRQP